jgi:ribonuclease BN (tRNA processing enzyme)
MTFRFVPLGVGDAFSALRYSTCLALVGDDDRLLLIDCPHPIQKMLREASIHAGISLDPAKVSGVVLTHLHADHCSGIEGFAYWTFFHQQRRLPLLIHPDVLADLWHGHLAAGMTHLMPSPGAPTITMGLESYFEIHELSHDRPTRFGDYTIETRPTIHHVPTTALRIRAGDRTLGHSADTAFDPALVAWLAEADLVVHETNYGVHTPYEKLAALPPEVRAKMRLIHYPDDFDLAASTIEPLHEGRIYSV